jgi:hypothetical protein
MTVLAGIGGDWHSLQGTSDSKWRNQLSWEIDGTLGNDENSGLPGTPLATQSEVARRWDIDAALGAGVRTIEFKSAPADGQFCVKWRRLDIDTRVDVVDKSIRTVLASGTLASYTAYSSVSNDCAIIEVSGVDFTTLVDKRVNFGSTGIARVVHANPNGLGTSFARITVPLLQDPDWRWQPFPAVPVVGQAVTVEGLGISFNGGIYECQGPFNRAPSGSPAGRPFGSIVGFRFTRSFNAVVGNGTLSNGLRLVDVDSRDVICENGALTQYGGTYSGRGVVILLHLLYGTIINRGADNAGLTDVNIQTAAGTSCQHIVARGVRLLIYTYAALENTSIYDTTGSGAIQVHNMGHLYVMNGIVGSNNTVGIMMSGVSRLVATGGTTALSIVGSSGNLSIPGGYITKSDLPRKFDTGGGTVTLGTDGIGTATIPAIPTDSIFTTSFKTVAGTPGTRITWSLTGTVVTFTSNDPGDRSTIGYTWYSPSTRTGSITA